MANDVKLKSKFLVFLDKHSKKIIIFISILVSLSLIVFGCYLCYMKIINKDVVATVGKEKITTQDLTNYQKDLSLGVLTSDDDLAKATNQQKKQFLNNLAERIILDTKAKELNINISDSEILTQAKLLSSDYSNLTDAQKAIVKNNAKYELLKEKVTDRVVTWSSGKFIVVRYDAHYASEPTLLDASKRKELAKTDKTYAATLANEIYSDIKSGKITFEQGMDKEINDSVVGKSIWGDWTVTQSQKYTKNDSIERNYPSTATNFWDKISETKVGVVSMPIQINVSMGNGAIYPNKDSVDGMYLIVKKDKDNKGEATSYETWLAKQLSSENFKIMTKDL